MSAKAYYTIKEIGLLAFCLLALVGLEGDITFPVFFVIFGSIGIWCQYREAREEELEYERDYRDDRSSRVS